MDNKTKKQGDKFDEAGKILLEELNHPSMNLKPGEKQKKGNVFLIPVLAIFTGLIVGAILIIFTSPEVYAGFKVSFSAGLAAMWGSVANAYSSLFKGSICDPAAVVKAFQTGQTTDIRNAINPFLESLVSATPYIFTGLAVALGFRSGLFNIGVEGQFYIGAAVATFVGFAFTGLPAYIHMPLAFLSGALGGAVWGFIPGWLKAKTGGHEVINTIMMNWIAINLTTWLLSSGPLQRPNANGAPISPEVLPSAQIPRLFPDPIRFHIGFFIALAFAFLVYWLLFRTTWGFDLRAVGANSSAARYAGINIVRTTILAMVLSGALAGMAGANQILGVDHSMSTSVSAGYGFDSIALALLGGSTPFGVVLASLLFGFLNNGATQMMRDASIPISIISVIQSFIIVFIAAPAVIRAIYRIRSAKASETNIVMTNWGGGKS
jgi:simple sugar transport system permease protein